MNPPKTTPDWTPEPNRIGSRVVLKEGIYQRMNWYVADDEEAAANARFYGAAQKMAAALEAAIDMTDDYGVGPWNRLNMRMREALREAGYTEEDES
jgi:hypothetical protein